MSCNLLPKLPGVYLIECTGNDKIYVGSATDMCRRRVCHIRDLRRGNHSNQKLQHAFDKYGEAAFVFYVLETVAISSLRAIEAYWIKALDAVKRGFNISYDTVAPMQGLRRPHSAETKRKMSLAACGRIIPEETRLKMSAAAKLRPHSKHSLLSRIKMSLARKGKPKSKEHRLHLSQALLGSSWSLARRAAYEGGL